MLEDVLDNELEVDLIPYLLMKEEVGKEEYESIFMGFATAKKLIYFYFDAYEDSIDAIRVFAQEIGKELSSTFVIYVKQDDVKLADDVLEKYPGLFSLFGPIEERFLRSLAELDLINVLASKQMHGSSLNLAKKILKEKRIDFSEDKIEELKIKLTKEKRIKSLVKRTVMFALILLAIAYALYSIV